MAIKRLEPDGSRSRAVAGGRSRKKRENRKPDAERIASEPWRSTGYGRAYRAARQAVIERQRGRCAVTGKKVAEKRGGTWRITEPGAGVHHRVPLSDGGDESPANLVLLSARAHALADAERRRRIG